MTSIRCRGFTLIELVITMVMMGILSAVVVTDISAKAQHSVTTQADQFRRNLSHLQLLAISRGARLRLTVAAGGAGYSVATCATSACTTRSALVDPETGANFSVVLDGVTLSPAGNILDFDSLGRPQSGGSLINATRSYTLTGSGRSVSVTVLPVTGFAQTSY